MIYQVMEPLKVKTPKGEMKLNPGQVINMDPGKANKLIEKRRIKVMDGSSQYKEMLSRIDKIYRSGDLKKMEAKNPSFSMELEAKEIKLLEAIYDGLDCSDIVRDIENFIKTTLLSIKG